MTDTTQPLRQLGRYALFGEIAAGGMASVHFGRLLGSAGFARTVVIKRMRKDLAQNNEFVEMFVDEARLASRIQHPNVVSTLDVVRDGAELFIVMEYVHGRSLDELIVAAVDKEELIPPRIVSALGVHALLGLHAAHEATSDSGDPLRLVHRDFSPHNVLVDVDGAARVVDFGVAKATQKIHKTREGQVKGKWAYMSPEQVAGDDLDRRSDIFAAGIVLWEALTCRRLFFHRNPARMATEITFKKVEPPSKHAPDCSKALDEVVLKALEKEPEDRYATAREMAKALRKAQPPTDMLDVSAWLEELAGDDLAAQAEKVAAIEKASAKMGVIAETAAVSLIDSGVGSDMRAAIEESKRAAAIAKRTLIGGVRAGGGDEPSKKRSQNKSEGTEESEPARKSEPTAKEKKKKKAPLRTGKKAPGDALAAARETHLGESDDIEGVIRALADNAQASSATAEEQEEPDGTVAAPEDTPKPAAVEATSVSKRRKVGRAKAPRDAGKEKPPTASEHDPESVPSISAATEQDADPARARVWVAVALVVIAILTLVVLIRDDRPEHERGADETREPAAPPATGEASSSPPRGPAPSSATSATPPPSAARLAPSTVATEPTPLPRPPSAPKVAPTAPLPKPGNNCDPPFTRRADGVKVFKPECF